MAEPIQVRALIARLEQLDTATGVEKTRLADSLKEIAVATLAAAGDHGVWQATRPGTGTREQAAAELETTVAYVQKRASRHSKRRK